MKELMLGLMVWASAHTGLPVATNMPVVVQVEPCQLFHMQYEGECPEAVADIPVAALYASGTIYLTTGWSMGDLYSVSALMHELIHHMQFEAGMPMTSSEGQTCREGNLEKPAYDAQIAWLEAAGADALSTMGMNDLALKFATECMRGY